MDRKKQSKIVYSMILTNINESRKKEKKMLFDFLDKLKMESLNEKVR